MTDRQIINNALDKLELYFSKERQIKTAFGLQSTLNGYEIQEIHLIRPISFVRIEVSMLSRCIQENDEPRIGDNINLVYRIDKDIIYNDNIRID